MRNSTKRFFHWYGEISDSAQALTITFYVVILFLGVIGNVMVFIVILNSKHMRNSTNLFLMNLGIADLILLLYDTPTTLVKILYNLRTVVKGKEMCLAFQYLRQTMIYASVLTILALTFERYYAICKPLKASYICTNKRAAVICMLVWVVAVVFASPVLVMYTFKFNLKEDGTETAVSYTNLGAWYGRYFLVTSIVFFFIPLVILIGLYSLIAKNLVSNSDMIDENTKNNKNYANAMKYRKQVVIMLVMVVLSFFVCLLPREVLRVSKILIPKQTKAFLGEELIHELNYVIHITLLLHSTLNPILYNFMSSKFREEFAKLLRINKLMKLCKNMKENMQRQETSNTLTSSGFCISSNSLDS